MSVAGRLVAAAVTPPYSTSVSINAPESHVPEKAEPSTATMPASSGVPKVTNSIPAKVVTVAASVVRMAAEHHRP